MNAVARNEKETNFAKREIRLRSALECCPSIHNNVGLSVAGYADTGSLELLNVVNERAIAAATNSTGLALPARTISRHVMCCAGAVDACLSQTHLHPSSCPEDLAQRLRVTRNR